MFEKNQKGLGEAERGTEESDEAVSTEPFVARRAADSSSRSSESDVLAETLDLFINIPPHQGAAPPSIELPLPWFDVITNEMTRTAGDNIEHGGLLGFMGAWPFTFWPLFHIAKDEYCAARSINFSEVFADALVKYPFATWLCDFHIHPYRRGGVQPGRSEFSTYDPSGPEGVGDMESFLLPPFYSDAMIAVVPCYTGGPDIAIQKMQLMLKTKEIIESADWVNLSRSERIRYLYIKCAHYLGYSGRKLERRRAGNLKDIDNVYLGL